VGSRDPHRRENVVEAPGYDPAIDELSRRAALRLAAAGAGAGAAALIASCGGGGNGQDTTQTISPERRRADAAVLNSLLDLERTAAIGYVAIGARLSGAARRTAAAFLAHERSHAVAIRRALGDLRVRAEPRRPDRDYAAGFPPMKSAEDALRFALDIEQTQIAAYGDSLATLFTPELRVTVATILATEAEHMSVVLGELHEPQAPKAFLVGKQPTKR
jgi:rubrerythrin